MRMTGVVLLVLSSFFLRAQDADFAGAHDQYTPVTMQATVEPVPFIGTDGMAHLDYELQLMNTTADPVTIVAVEVLDDSGSSLLKLEGDELKKWFTLVDKTSTTRLGPAQVGYVWLDVQVGGLTPRALRHRITVLAKEKALRNSAMAATGVEESLTLDGGEVMVAKERRLVLGPPLEGKGWVAMSACCGNMGHRRAGIPINGGYFVGQRFAIDWIKLGDDSRLVRPGGKIDVNKDYPTYGVNVLAVADGTVVSVLDGLPERTAGALPTDTTLQNVTGNHVILDLGGGRYGFYAHLQPGSIKVKKGDHVKKGQVLALVGNSGNTTGPHLHFHVMDGLSVLGAQGVPYVIDSFTLAGEIRDIPDEEGANAFLEALSITPQPPPQRRMEYPMENAVVDFRDGK
jgi:hypothetical protein